MVAAATDTAIASPDSGARNPDVRLQEHASRAALYVTHPARRAADAHNRNHNPRDVDQKLSSAGAAVSLKYARPQDLPSFPVVGADKTASAGAAATLAHNNKQTPELWRPEASAAAGRAALLANDYRMAPQWHPEPSTAGSRAAILAHRDRDSVRPDHRVPTTRTEGNSAAGIAMKKKNRPPQPDPARAEDERKWALQAAVGSVQGRQRSDNTLIAAASYPDAANAKPNALTAATTAHRPRAGSGLGSDAMEAARVHNIGSRLPKEMYTEHPPVQIELDEKQHQAALRASAISFAKQMYEAQGKHLKSTPHHHDDQTTAAVRATHHERPRSSPAASQDLRQEAMQYIALQETAQRLATERLAKMNKDDDTQFRDYYGYSGNSTRSSNTLRSRLSIRSHHRRRASVDGAPPAIDSDDEEQARRIRNQTSRLHSGVAGIDSKKRDADRLALLAVAERRVQERMHDLDEKVYHETGKASRARIDEWDAKARAIAVAESESRMKNHGRVHLGNGKYLEQSEVDRIARERIQPTLDQISDKAEKQRAKDEERKLDEEVKKREVLKDKERQREVKAESKRLKSEEKAAEKAAEKARKKEGKAKIKDEKRASKHLTTVGADNVDHDQEAPGQEEMVEVEQENTMEVFHDAPQQPGEEDGGRPKLEQRQSIVATLERHISAIPSSGSSSSSSLNDVDAATAPSNKESTYLDYTAYGLTKKETSENTTQRPRSRGQQNDPPTSPSRDKGFKGLIGKLTGKKKLSPGALKPFTSSGSKEGGEKGNGHLTFSKSPSKLNAGSDQPLSPKKGNISNTNNLSDTEELRERGRREQKDAADLTEEAKDTVDEALIPAPKYRREERQSPVRQTVFHEEL